MVAENASNGVSAIKPSQFTGLFALQESTALNWPKSALTPNRLNALELLVARYPQRLIGHVQRINYYYQADLSEQLYGALVDLFVVLDRQGMDICWRMLNKAESRLPDKLFNRLVSFLQDSNSDARLLPGNSYSLFSKGLIGIPQLIALDADEDVLVQAKLCREYDHLDRAEVLLEKAVTKYPGRMDIQQELMTLYQMMDNVTKFKQLIDKLTHLECEIYPGWRQIDHYFKERSR